MTIERVVFVFFIVGTIAILWFLWLHELKVTEKNFFRFNEVNKTNARIAEKLAKWQRKIADFKHMLTGESWRDSAGKKEFVAVVYDDNIPGYLWYALGSQKLSDERMDALCKLFWDENPRFGDLELHVSNHPEIGTALRIRNPERFVTEVIVNGRACPLYQTGHSLFGASEAGCISFLSLYDKEVVV